MTPGLVLVSGALEDGQASRAARPSLAAPPGAMAYVTTCDSSVLSLAWAQQNCCAAMVSSRAVIPWVASHCCASLPHGLSGHA